MSETRYCRDCKHCAKDNLPAPGWRCVSPKNVAKVSPVTGETTYDLTYCVSHREGPNGCGPNGKWFEARVGVDTHA